MSPAPASDMRKVSAMSVRSPMGMNSEVLKIKAEKVSPKRGSHSRSCIRSFIEGIPFRFYTMISVINRIKSIKNRRKMSSAKIKNEVPEEQFPKDRTKKDLNNFFFVL